MTITSYDDFLREKVNFDKSFGFEIDRDEIVQVSTSDSVNCLIGDRIRATPNRVLQHSPGPNPESIRLDWRATVNGTRNDIPAPRLNNSGRQKNPLDSDRYGRLAVVESVVGGWLCKCDCGSAVIVTGWRLQNGKVVSCGCFHRERQHETARTHGMKNTQVYTAWINMRQRCSNQNRPDWANYGGRGIRVCTAWQDSFEAFLADMGEPKTGESIDRIDANGNYELGNCRWATATQQSRNKRSNRMLTINGEARTLVEWCELRDVPYFTAHARLRRGATAEEAIA
ncbi:hypothetical protein [Cryobacterium melibiosiphilum]|uniref:hypothetical protein n=1 Tax=Cryobacterium melibiosiphilum TaxID=995039 RepID=UPI0011C2281E|nr:hypothetical protein [Cryobacterium melibiosiphilum]